MLALLPTVIASHFTGTFNDYGTDTGSDGLFDYLTIDVQVQITTTSNDYMVLAMLEDSQGNLLEYNDCMDITQTGQQNIRVNFNGLDIYKNKVNGPYNLKYLGLSTISSCTGFGTPPEGEHSLENAHSTQSYQYTEFQKGDPAVSCQSSPCVASSALIKSRGNVINMPEPNYPNTIDGCEDGSSGTYLNSESIESITVTSRTNNFFKIGDNVDVEMQVYCDSTFDKLNFAYTNNLDDIQWNIKDNKQCTSIGLKTLSTSFTLDNNVGQHGVRGIFGFSLSQNNYCGINEYDDNDDVVIYVKECNQDTNCPIKGCNHLDSSIVGCYQGTYRDYNNLQNTCNQDFTCTTQTCTSYNELITDIDGDGYDTECDNDCDDSLAAGFNINPGKEEICDNGIDDNCNNKIDNNDPECLGQYELYIKKGWNLFSLPRIENNNIAEIADIFNNNFQSILTLKGNEWHVYDKTINSNLDQLTEADGFWINAGNNLTIRVDNEAPPPAIFDLKKGWNIIGYPSLEEKYVQYLFQNVMGDIEIIYIYNNPLYTTHFTSFNPEQPTNFLIKPGMGIIIKVKNNITWKFDDKYNEGNEIFNLTLLNDWNLISLPLISDKTKSEIFGSTPVYYLKNNQWIQSNGDDKINYSSGYWIKTTPMTIQIEGHIINNLDYGINQGWNLINYPLTEEESITTFFQNTLSSIEMITLFEDGEWKNFNPEKPAHLNSLINLKPGKGIFIKAKSNAKWRFDGNELRVE